MRKLGLAGRRGLTAAASLALLTALWGCSAAAGRTFYVDFDAGADARDGLSPEGAFKRSPGDPAAEGNAKATALEPGDTVIFKGGVTYRGNVVCRWSGGEGKPITFDGNTAGTFGRGRAIVDGSQVIGDWQCCDPRVVGGGPKATKIMTARVPIEGDPVATNLYQGDALLWLAQDPNPSEPFYMDRQDSYRPIPVGKATPTSISDEQYFTQPSADAWNGAYVAVWAQPNYTYFQKVTGYNPVAHTIHYEKLPAPHYEQRGRYAMLNHPRLINGPGQYTVSPEPNGTAVVHLWPLKNPNVDRYPDNPDVVPVTFSQRGTGFNVAGRSHITVRGFVIQKFLSRNPNRGAGVSSDQAGAADIVVADNVIRHCNKENTTWKHAGINLTGVAGGRVENNTLYDNRRIGGIYLLGGSTGIDVRHNTVRHCGYVGIWLIGSPQCRIIGNTVLDNRGTHANAITVYNGSDGVLVIGNRVRNSQIAVSVEKIRDVTFAYNDFVSPSYTVVNWYESSGLKFHHNVILSADKKALHLGLRDTSDCVVRNNILGGLLINEPFDVSHNLFVSHYQGFDALRKKLGRDILTETDLARIFVDPAEGDYRLRPGSPAIDAGADLGYKTDLAGTPVPQGKAPDIGAYEFRPSPTKGNRPDEP
jgi:parallel beta-helix repeat protein